MTEDPYILDFQRLLAERGIIIKDGEEWLLMREYHKAHESIERNIHNKEDWKEIYYLANNRKAFTIKEAFPMKSELESRNIRNICEAFHKAGLLNKHKQKRKGAPLRYIYRASPLWQRESLKKEVENYIKGMK